MMDPFTLDLPQRIPKGRTVYLPTIYYTKSTKWRYIKYDRHGPSGYMNVVDLDGKLYVNVHAIQYHTWSIWALLRYPK